MNRILLIVITFCSSQLLGQQARLQFDVSFGVNRYEMDSLNNKYIEDFLPIFIEEPNKISSGWATQVGAKYHASKFWGLGVGVGLDYGKSANRYLFEETDVFGNVINSYYNNFDVVCYSLTPFITNDLYILNFLKSHNDSSRFRISIGNRSGLSISRIELLAIHPALPYSSDYYYMTGQGFHTSFYVRFEYDIIQKSLVNSLSAEFGFQHQKSGNLIFPDDSEWILDNYPMTLDFSGFYARMIISVGK